MREQRVRLDKRKGTEVPLGKMTGSITQQQQVNGVRPEMRTSGVRLAESLGTMAKVGATAMKAQDVKDKADVIEARRVAKEAKEKEVIYIKRESFNWDKELSALPTDNDRASYIEEKLGEFQTEPNKLKAFSTIYEKRYNSYVKGAHNEGQAMYKGRAIDLTAVALDDGDGASAYNQILESESFKNLDNQGKQGALNDALLGWAKEAYAGATTKEEIQEVGSKVSSFMTEYNKSPYYGASGAKAALSLKKDLTTKLTSLQKNASSSAGTQATDAINLSIAQNQDKVQVLNKIDSHPTWSKDKKELEKIKVEDKYKKTEHLINFKNGIDIHSGSNNVNYNNLTTDEKKIFKDEVNYNLDYSMNNGAWESFALTATANEAIGTERMKSTFGNWKSDGQDVIGKNLSMIKDLKTTEHGPRALTFLSADTLAFYSMLETNPDMDVEMLRSNLIASKGQQPFFGDTKSAARSNRKKLRKLKEDLSPSERNVADKLFNIYSNNMDADDALDLLEKHYVDLNTQESDGGMSFRGFAPSTVNYVEDGIKNYIFKDADVDTDNLHVTMEAGEMTIYDAANPLMPAIRMPYSSFVSTIGALKSKEVEEGKDIVPGGMTSNDVKAFTNSIKNPYYDDFDSSIIGSSLKDGWLGHQRDVFKNLIGGSLDTVVDILSPTEAQGNTKLYDHLVSREGFKDTVYKDSLGKPTVGIGHLLTPTEKKKYPVGTKIPQAQLDTWFKEDTAGAITAASKQIKQVKGSPSKLEFALISMNFQLGSGWTKKFPTAWKHMKNGDFKRAAAELRYTSEGSGKDSGWYTQTPTRVNDIVGVLNEL